jgi:hypothetical protein
MSIPTHVRVERGYFKRYYERTKEVRRSEASERMRWHYRLGWAEYLIEELVAYWYAESTGQDQRTLDAILHFQPTSDQWTRYVSAGRSRLSIGSHEKQIRSIT